MLCLTELRNRLEHGEALQRDFKQIEESHGNKVLNMVLAKGFVAKLLGNARVVR